MLRPVAPREGNSTGKDVNMLPVHTSAVSTGAICAIVHPFMEQTEKKFGTTFLSVSKHVDATS